MVWYGAFRTRQRELNDTLKLTIASGRDQSMRVVLSNNEDGASIPTFEEILESVGISILALSNSSFILRALIRSSYSCVR